MPHPSSCPGRLPAALLLTIGLLATSTVRAQQVGIGTAAPTQMLDVNGAVRVRALSTPGMVTTDAQGNLGSTAAPLPESTTAGNGLSQSGTTIQLGGTLTQPVVFTQAGNSLRMNGMETSLEQIEQYLSNASAAVPASPYGIGQSFTLPAGATVTGFQVNANAASTGTFTFFQGAPGGAVLASQAVSYAAGTGTAVALATPVTVASSGMYSFSTGSSASFFYTTTNTMLGGSRYDNTTAVPANDLQFSVTYSTTTPTVNLFVRSSGGVGIGTAQPSAQLDVTGQVRLRALSSYGMVYTDHNGYLNVGPYPIAESTTASNGLTLTDDDVALGGALTAHTQVPLAGHDLSFSGSGKVGIGTAAPAKRLHVDAGSDYLRLENLATVPASTAAIPLVLDASGNLGKSAVGAPGQVLRFGLNSASYSPGEKPLRFNAADDASTMGNTPSGVPNFLNTIAGATFSDAVPVVAGTGAPARTTDQVSLPAGTYRVTLSLTGSYGTANAANLSALKFIVNNSEYSLRFVLPNPNTTNSSAEVSEYITLSSAGTLDFTIGTVSGTLGLLDRVTLGGNNSYRSLVMIERLR